MIEVMLSRWECLNYWNVSLATISSKNLSTKRSLILFHMLKKWTVGYVYIPGIQKIKRISPCFLLPSRNCHTASAVFNYVAIASFPGTCPNGEHCQPHSKAQFPSWSDRSPGREGVVSHLLSSFHLLCRPSWTTAQSCSVQSLSDQDSELRVDISS